MMSGNSSHVNMKKIMWNMTGRRMSILVISILFWVIFYPVAVLMLIVRSDNSALAQAMSQEQTFSQRLSEVSGWIGLRQEFAVLVLFLAALIALTGFYYLFDPVKVDFFECQPFSRKQRFRLIYLDGVFIFELPFLICFLLTLAIAAGMHGLDSVVLAEAWIQFLRINLCAFATYNLTILAVMLCGNLVSSIFVTVFLHVIDLACHYELDLFERAYFPTYAGERAPLLAWSPIYHMEMAYRNASSYYRDCQMTDSLLRRLLGNVWKEDLGELVFALLVLFLVVHLYRKRKAESAGHSVLHRPVRIILRISCGITVSLFIADLLCSVLTYNNTIWSMLPYLVACTMTAAVLITGFMESVFENNIRAFFNGTWQMVVAAAVSVFILCVFQFDLIGYNTYIPKADDVSYAVIETDAGSGYIGISYKNNSGYMDVSQLESEYMRLTNIRQVEKLAAIGQRQIVSRQITSDNSATADGWTMKVIYHMKNGQTVSRSLLITPDVDPDLMNSIFGSTEFIEGSSFCFHQDLLDVDQKNMQFRYTNGIGSVSVNGLSLRGFLDAYGKDILNLNYSQASAEIPVGEISCDSSESAEMNISIDFPVYEGFTNSLSWLSENGMYLDPLAEDKDLAGITIVGYNAESYPVYKKYTDQEQIDAIMQASKPDGISTLWQTYSYMGSLSLQYNVAGADDEQQILYSSATGSFMEQVPDFVSEDMQALGAVNITGDQQTDR